MSGSAHELDAFISAFDRPGLARRASELSGRAWTDMAFETFVDTYLNEVKVGFDLIKPHLSTGKRILEVGAGVGFLTAYLKSLGNDVAGIEPGAGGGFGFMPAMIAAVREQLAAEARPEILPIAAEHLTPDQHGRFDLIFSVNVIEHVMALEDAVAAMKGVLAPDGLMIHLCPNYAFPYEPHLAIPLIPGVPRLTRFVLRRAITRNRHVWDTVNFVTAGRVRQCARANGLVCHFQDGVMKRFFERGKGDMRFRERQAGVIGRLAASEGASSIVGHLLKRVPTGLATPMIFLLSHADGTNEKSVTRVSE